MIPDDQMIVVYMNQTKKPIFSGRVAENDNLSVLKRGGAELQQQQKAQNILDFFKDHNSGKKKIDYEYRDTINTPGNALIATYDNNGKKWGLSTTAYLDKHLDHYFIGYAARSLFANRHLSKFIFPYKYLNMFIKCIEPYFEQKQYAGLRASIDLSHDLKQLDKSDAEAIESL